MKPLTAKLSQDASTDQPAVQTEYWDSGLGAAGCIFVARDTGRILIAHRNGEEDPHQGFVEEPDTWATWGGKIDDGESPKEAVVREVEEETGYDGEYKLAHLWTYEDESEGFQYHNFLAIVQNEFLPKRSWENDRGKWVEWGEWPHPMHFGLKALLQHAGEKIHRVVTLIKRKKAGIIKEMDTPPAIVQPANATANYNITNAYIVATTLWGEARGEGEKGMQAVMNVIMNRAKGDFKKAKDIVLAPKQFSMWNSVTNAEGTALAAAQKYRSDEAWQRAIRIVDQAAEGHLADITGGATFYFNPKKANPSWAKKMAKTVTIGNHDFYKPRKMVKKKVPAAIREMIESQNPHQAVLFNKGIAGDGIWEYELKSPHSYLRYRHEPDTKTFYLDNIGTPNLQDQDKGYAKALLETFFQLIKGQGGALDSGPYTTSGNAYVKHVVERLSKQYGVRLVKGRDQINESVESPDLKRWFGKSKVVDKHGDPLVVWKAMKWTDDKGSPITHIQRPEALPSFHGDEPGTDIAGFFTSDASVADKFSGFNKGDEKKAFYLRMENPFVIDLKNKPAGFAQFFESGKPFRDAMRSKEYDGAIILNTSDEGNVFVIKDPRQAKLAINKTFGPDKDFTKETLSESKLNFSVEAKNVPPEEVKKAMQLLYRFFKERDTLSWLKSNKWILTSVKNGHTWIDGERYEFEYIPVKGQEVTRKPFDGLDYTRKMKMFRTPKDAIDYMTANEKKHEGHYAFRGMNMAEWVDAQKQGYIKSKAEYNLGGVSQTYYGSNWSTAHSYAGGFAPFDKEPTRSLPGVIVAVPFELTKDAKATTGMGSHEERVAEKIPLDQVKGVWYIVPIEVGRGSMELVLKDGNLDRGSASPPSAKFVIVPKSGISKDLNEAYGDPGDHVVFGGVFWPDRVVANVVKSHNSYFGHTHEHGPTRWSYYQGIKTVFWKNYPPAVPEWEIVVKDWLEKRGYKVDKQTDKENYYKIMQWYHDRGLLKEMEDGGVILGALDRNGSNIQPVHSADQLANHPSYMKVTDRRWRYYPELKQLDWQGSPTPEEHEGTKEFLAQRGLMVRRVHYLAGSVKKESTLLMEAITDEQAKAANKSPCFKRRFEPQVSLQKQTIKVAKSEKVL